MRRFYALLLCLNAAPYTRAQIASRPFVTPAQMDFEANDPAYFATPRGPMDTPWGETVSVTRLAHRPPAKAQSAFLRGLKLANRAAWPQAAAEFEKAAAIDPAFSEAQCDLGVAYTWLEKYDDAAAALRQAIALDPSTGVHHVNLAYTLLQLNRERDARQEAQTAVDLDPTYSKGQFMLGILLARHAETRGQAAPHLEFASRQVPEAHLVLAEVYRFEGALGSAEAQIKLYRKAQGSKAQLSLEK